MRRDASLRSCLFRLFGLVVEVEAHAVDAKALVDWLARFLALEQVAQMAPAVVADDLGALHSGGRIVAPANGIRYGIEEGRPPALGAEFVQGFEERRIAGGAVVDALAGVVLVVLPGPGHFSALVAEDAELLWQPVSAGALAIERRC